MGYGAYNIWLMAIPTTVREGVLLFVPSRLSVKTQIPWKLESFFPTVCFKFSKKKKKKKKKKNLLLSQGVIIGSVSNLAFATDQVYFSFLCCSLGDYP
jgi:hypothetical protein